MRDKIGTASGPDEALRNLITEVIKGSGMSRAEIAEKLSLHVGQSISKRMLDDWTAESKKRARFPACFIQAFCEVTGNDQLQRHMLSERLRELLSLGETAERVLARQQRKQVKRSKR